MEGFLWGCKKHFRDSLTPQESGEYAWNEEECLKRLLQVHFPGFQRSHWWRGRIPEGYKILGTDEVYPVLLKKGLEDLRRPLTKLFRASINQAWKSSRVAFLAKPGRVGYTAAKGFRPISLTSFILTVLEKLVKRHNRDGGLCGGYRFGYRGCIS